MQAGKVAALSGVAASWLAAGNANAATELMQVAAGDNRPATIALLLLPALGWVGFNMISGITAQLDQMAAKIESPKASKRRSVGAALGLGAAALLAAPQADAATELMQVAASDNRVGIIALLLLPVLAWGGFNIISSGFAQLDQMAAKNAPKGKKGRK